MSLIGAMAPPAAKGAAAREAAIGAARDAAAAAAIATAAVKGNPHAAAFTREAQQLLGAAAVRRARAARLRDGSATAASCGFDGLARRGSDAALVEERAADRMAASVIHAVREAHASGFGYLSPEEQRLLRQKTTLEAMTQHQLEQSFADMLRKMDHWSASYGASDDVDEDDLSGDEVIDEIGAAAQIFGGDMPALYGGDSYGIFKQIANIFKPSADRLRRRLKRKLERLQRMEAKLEAKEDADKKGLAVKILRLRINKTEKSIARIRRKLAKLVSTVKAADVAKKEADKLGAAETQIVKEAIADEEDNLGDEQSDDEIISALEVFGAIRPRVARARMRVRRLRRAARGAPPRRRRRLRRRAARLRRAVRATRRPHPRWRRHRRHVPLSIVPVPVPQPVYVAPEYVPVADEAFIEPDGMYEDGVEEGDDLDYDDGDEEGYVFGASPGKPVIAAYFANRAALFGAHGLSEDEIYGKGFFESIRDFFSRLVGQGQAVVDRQKTAAQAAREARRPLTPEVRKQRRELREATRSRRRAGRKAYVEAGGPVPLPIPAEAASAAPSRASVTRIVHGAGGYVYQVNPDASIKILQDPTGKAAGKILSSGPAYEAIWTEIRRADAGVSQERVLRPRPTEATIGAMLFGADLGPLETIVTAPRGERVAALARALDRALAQYGPEIPAEDDLDDEDDDDLDDEDDVELGWL